MWPVLQKIVEYSDKFLILGPLAEEFFLLIIAKSTANIGQISYEIKKNRRRSSPSYDRTAAGRKGLGWMQAPPQWIFTHTVMVRRG